MLNITFELIHWQLHNALLIRLNNILNKTILQIWQTYLLWYYQIKSRTGDTNIILSYCFDCWNIVMNCKARVFYIIDNVSRGPPQIIKFPLTGSYMKGKTTSPARKMFSLAVIAFTILSYLSGSVLGHIECRATNSASQTLKTKEQWKVMFPWSKKWLGSRWGEIVNKLLINGLGSRRG